MRHCEYLVIGQGLAGTILAWKLKTRGKAVIIIDNGHLSAASKVAAGIVNPLAGKRLALYPETEAFLSSAEATYTSLETQLEQIFWHKIPLWRFFQDAAEADRYDQRRQDEAFRPYLGKYWQPDQTSFPAGNTLGGFTTLQSAWVNLPALITATRNYFLDSNMLIEATFNPTDLSLTETKAVWCNTLSAQHVLFCEGWKGRNNPWFDGLPWDPVKGEILDLSLEGIPREQILNRGKWLVPGPGQRHRAGATYCRDRLDLKPTEKGRDKIVHGLEQLLPGQSFDIIDHRAGIRAGSRTQHPLIGHHQKWQSLGLFNGFGSRGALLTPLYADKYIAACEAGESLAFKTC